MEKFEGDKGYQRIVGLIYMFSPKLSKMRQDKGDSMEMSLLVSIISINFFFKILEPIFIN
jgi:hypothetical protein